MSREQATHAMVVAIHELSTRILALVTALNDRLLTIPAAESSEVGHNRVVVGLLANEEEDELYAWRCKACGWTYLEETGTMTRGDESIQAARPGTRFFHEAWGPEVRCLALDWKCQKCGSPKTSFDLV